MKHWRFPNHNLAMQSCFGSKRLRIQRWKRLISTRSLTCPKNKVWSTIPSARHTSRILLNTVQTRSNSATKYINGHSDVVMGVVCTSSEEIYEWSGCSAITIWLLHESQRVETLHVRMEAAARWVNRWHWHRGLLLVHSVKIQIPSFSMPLVSDSNAMALF